MSSHTKAVTATVSTYDRAEVAGDSPKRLNVHADVRLQEMTVRGRNCLRPGGSDDSFPGRIPRRCVVEGCEVCGVGAAIVHASVLCSVSVCMFRGCVEGSAYVSVYRF